MREIPTDLTVALSSRYRFERELGAGGMAIVYLARDLKHERDVAIKVLKPEVAAAIGGNRFLSEIRTTGNLKHPHILPLFDSGSAGSLLYFVMPFIDGESLGARLRREGALPIADVVHILYQVVDALAYAHGLGVVHRDLKPDNILLSGRHVFLADFGVARLQTTDSSAPTKTGTGAMVGTPCYMSPEQIVGSEIDHRSDIYALGVLAYELLAGVPPFAGSPQDVIAAQLTRLPEPVTRHRPETPPSLAALVMRCLQKQPGERWQRTEDVRATLEEIEKNGLRTPARARSFTPRTLIVAAAVLIGLGSSGVWYAGRETTPSPVLSVGRITHLTTEPGLELDPAIAPDGRTIAYAAGPPGRLRVYLRQLAGSQIVPLLDERFTDVHRWPQWSSDGARIVFQAGRQALSGRVSIGAGMIYEAPALGGNARRLTEFIPGNLAMSPSLSFDGKQIVFSSSGGLYAMGSEGDSMPRLLIADSELHSPRWSPDGEMIAYVSGGSVFTFGEESLGNVETSSLRVLVVNTGRVNRITNGDWLDTNPIWLPDSRTLLFVSSRGGSRDIYSIRLTSGGEPDGDPVRLTSGVNAHGISISADGGLLAYSSYTPRANIWSIDIPARGISSVARARQVTFGNEKIEKLAVSRDGQWLAYDSDRSGRSDIWKVPIAGGTPEQVTRGPNHKFMNDWSPDGREIVFHSIGEGGQRDVYVISADGTRTESVVATPQEEQHAGWGPDTNTIILDITPPSAGINEWQSYVVTRSRRGAPWGPPRQVTQNGSSDPKWSPDGRLIAFCAKGQLRVIAPDGTGERVLVQSTSGNEPEPAYPVWSNDSRTIYYKAYDQDRNSTIWSVPVTGGPPRLLVRFDDPSRRSLRREFATDGRRFYFTVAHDESDLWTMELLKK
jgi:Tol biopolymer transport system component